jgi:hypothetical protein
MIICTHCDGCGERATIYGLGGALGFQCAECASHAPCHDCDRLYHKGALHDLGDGYWTCEDCIWETQARRASAARTAHV